ncbi:MAG: hypothetical protein HW380_2434 [Magnetococcales bacterium]|nr:hypothetical protein [Magnetococcales bacterium]HIJ83138.1 B12-binding domain-containing radical SAM protein [Magnetococcales bacterium]
MVAIAFVYSPSVTEPLGIAYLSSYIKLHFPDIKIRLFNPQRDAIEELVRFEPTLVMYSLMSTQYLENIQHNNHLKKRMSSFISVFGGPHPTYFPEMVEEDGVDIVCRGDGEVPIKNLLQAIVDQTDICHIAGLWVKQDGIVYRNPVDSVFQDIEIVYPDREMLYQASPFLANMPKKSILTTRGCPFKCTYCHNSGYSEIFKSQGKILRKRTPKSVVDEITALMETNRNMGFIDFLGEVFPGINKEWMREFTDLYTSKVGLPYWVSLRAEFITDELVRDLRRSGCVSVGMAIETSDYEYRKKYLNRKMTNEKIYQSIHSLESAGIAVGSPIMLGLPFAGFENDMNTLKMVCESNPTYANTCIFQPYEGLPITEQCKANGLIAENSEPSLANFYSKASIKGIDYQKVLKLNNLFTLLHVLHRWFKIDVEVWFYRIPDWKFFHFANMVAKYFSYRKIIRYKRGIMNGLMEIYVALSTNIFGYGKNKNLW